MSTRHVWAYSNPVEREYIIQTFSGATVSVGWQCCSSVPTKNANGNYVASGSVRNFEYANGGLINGNTNIRVSSYPYIVGPNLPYYYHAEDATDANKGNINYYLINGVVSGWKILFSEQYYLTINKCEIRKYAGSTISYVSSNSSNTYPSDGVSSSYWYKYLGSDSIDPVSITYPSSIEYVDENTKLPYTITGSKSNVYGGTIEYKKDSKKNGGNWDGSTSSWKTNLTGSYSGFESDIKTYQLRVHARDGWGFESTTYITGPVCTFTKRPVVTLNVNPSKGGTVSGAGEYSSGSSVTVRAVPSNGWEFVNWTKNGTSVSTNASYTFTVNTSTTLVANFKQKLQLWVGVNGKARKATDMWVGVNGKARKVVEAWIGVNGKARRFL